MMVPCHSTWALSSVPKVVEEALNWCQEEMRTNKPTLNPDEAKVLSMALN